MATEYSVISPAIIKDEIIDGIRHISVSPSSLVCCSQIDIELENDVINRVQYTNGCSGNTQGVAALVKGMKIDEACNRLSGINCKGRGTSCPDQLAIVLKYALETAAI